MKEVAARTIGKIHGKAARRGMAKNLRNAIKKRRVTLKRTRISGRNQDEYQVARKRVRDLKTEEKKRKELRIVRGMNRGDLKEVQRFWKVFGENKRKKPVSLHLEDSEGNIDVRQDKQLKIVESHWSKLYSKQGRDRKPSGGDRTGR